MAAPAYLKKKARIEETLKESDALTRLAAQLVEAKDAKNKAKEAESAASKIITALEAQIAEVFSSRGCDLVRIPNLGTFSVSIVNRPSISDKDAFIAWLDEHEMGSIAHRTVHPKTLESFVKEWLADGNNLPPALNNFVQTRINVRKAGQKHGNETDDE